MLACLDLLPLLEDLTRSVDVLRRAKDVGVTTDQFVGDGTKGIGDREAPGVGLDLREEHTLEEEIPDLAAKVFVIPAVDRFEHLVGFFEHERPQ